MNAPLFLDLFVNLPWAWSWALHLGFELKVNVQDPGWSSWAPRGQTWLKEAPCCAKSHQQGCPFQLQLCAAVPQLHTLPKKTWSEKCMAFKYPWRDVSFEKSSAKTLTVCVGRSTQRGTGRTLTVLRKPQQRRGSEEQCGWGERWGQREINSRKAAPRGTAQTGRAAMAGAVFLPPNSLRGSIIFYLLWASPCAIESTGRNKAKAEAMLKRLPIGNWMLWHYLFLSPHLD